MKVTANLITTPLFVHGTHIHTATHSQPFGLSITQSDCVNFTNHLATHFGFASLTVLVDLEQFHVMNRPDITAPVDWA